MFDLSARPTHEQMERFRGLSVSERYAWLAGMLTTLHTMATPEARARWRALKQAHSGGFLSVVHRFTAALDAQRFDEAGEELAPGCEYRAPSTVLTGSAAIVSRYRAVWGWAPAGVACERCRCGVEPLSPGVARITFEVRLEHRGATHVHRFSDVVHVGRSRRIEQVQHEESAGEQAALDAYLVKVGVTRASPRGA